MTEELLNFRRPLFSYEHFGDAPTGKGIPLTSWLALHVSAEPFSRVGEMRWFINCHYYNSDSPINLPLLGESCL